MMLTKHRFSLLVVLLLWLAACGQGETPQAAPLTAPTATVKAQLAATAAATPTLALTPTPPTPPSTTATPTFTPTPTATAVPLTVLENTQLPFTDAPLPQAGAPCGVVDTFDFPLNPPDAEGYSGGSDFGVYRSRYEKYHAGEDWWYGSRGSSFGKPVYSIGHGLVTYAEPEGWNRDKGVIIIQHTFVDGSQVLSFYGHLDPPSFLIETGTCVTRGQHIADIGRPRGSPHLHFEIRTQSPYTTLTGYWPEDPRVMGWLPPSQTIWTQRMNASPFVTWNRPYQESGTKGVGLLGDETFVMVEAAQLVGLNMSSGAVQWRYDTAENVYSALMDRRSPVVYLADRAGHLQAISLRLSAGQPTFAPLWQAELDVFGTLTLLPLPDGGVVAAARQQLFAFDTEGTPLWTTSNGGTVSDWAMTETALFITTTDGEHGLWQIDGAGIEAWQGVASGQVVAAANHLWLYTRDMLYRLDTAARTAEPIYALPPGLLSLSDALALPDGGLLLAHADPSDRRLLLFNSDGSLRWERSYEGLVAGAVHLQQVGNQHYLVAQDDQSSTSHHYVYALDLERAELTHLFTGGTRSPQPNDTWIISTPTGLLMNIGGGNLVTLSLPGLEP